jgi:hypothetical protein
VEDIVGLYMSPPAHAAVLSIDEKSQIQALSRTCPNATVKPGRPATQTHDYGRHGIRTLFAALDVLDGAVLGRCMQRHRPQEFIRSPGRRRGESAGRQGRPCHSGQLRRPQAPAGAGVAVAPSPLGVPLHPDLASWINAVEGFFSALTRRRLKRGDFRSVVDLQAAIHRYIAEHNDDPRPFTWTKPARDILRRVNRHAEPAE